MLVAILRKHLRLGECFFVDPCNETAMTDSPVDSVMPHWSAMTVTNQTRWIPIEDDSRRTLPASTETSIYKEKMPNMPAGLPKCVIRQSTEKAIRKTTKKEKTTKKAADTKRLRVQPTVKKDGARPPTLVFEASRDQYKAWTGVKGPEMYKTCKVTARISKAAAATECRQWLRWRCKELGLACTI